jgi:hypothetical protein
MLYQARKVFQEKRSSFGLFVIDEKGLTILTPGFDL